MYTCEPLTYYVLRNPCLLLMQQHLAARRIREFYAQLSYGWIGTRTSEPMFPNAAFQEWIQTMTDAGQSDLVKLVKQECRAFASVLIASVKKRLEPYWSYIQSLELIDPLGKLLGYIMLCPCCRHAFYILLLYVCCRTCLGPIRDTGSVGSFQGLVFTQRNRLSPMSKRNHCVKGSLTTVRHPRKVKDTCGPPGILEGDPRRST